MNNSLKVVILITVALFGIPKLTNAQFDFSIGWNMIKSSKFTQYTRTIESNDTSYTKDIVELRSDIGINIYTKYNFLRLKRNKLSIGIPLSVGLAPSPFFSSHLTMDLNGGFMAEPMDLMDKKIGYFIGVGYGFYIQELNYKSTSVTKAEIPSTDNVAYNKKNGFGDIGGLIKSPATNRYFSKWKPLIHVGFGYDLLGLWPLQIRFYASPPLNKNANYYGIGISINGRSKSGFIKDDD